VSILPCYKMSFKLDGDRVSTTQVDLFSFRSSLDPSRQNKYPPATTVQLLTKKGSIVLSFHVRISVVSHSSHFS
jgi:hypothetical protein